MPNENQIQTSQQRNIVKWAILAILVVIALFVLQWFSNRAYIDVAVTSNSSNPITYRFVSQESQKVTEVKDTAKHLKKRLSKGDYEVTVLQDNTSSVSIVTASGSVTKITATPQPERGRQFVGNQPRSCANLVAGLLFSYTCGDTLGTLQTHQPATTDSPTLTDPVAPGSEDMLEGLVHTQAGKDIVVAREADEAEQEFSAVTTSPHNAFELNATSNNLGDRVALSDLNPDSLYKITAYKAGFIAYSKLFDQLFYYSSLDAKPIKLRSDNLRSQSLQPYALSAQDQTYLIAYNEKGGQKNAVVVYTDSGAKQYSLDKKLDSVRLCGRQKLCGMRDGWLEVYNLANKNAQLLYRLSSVKAIANSATENHLVVVRKRDVVDLDVESRSGVSQYGFNGYSFCGLYPSADSYILCVSSPNVKAALLIDQGQVSDNIDKKIASLATTPEIDTLSIYKDIIFISPRAVREIPNPEPEGRGFIFDPTAVKNTNDKINAKLKQLKVDQTTYHIINTFE